MSYKETVEARLVSRLKITPQGCWVWTGRTNAGGYGTMGINMKGRARRIALVHRVAAWLWLDVDLDGSHEVCHTCDNPPCCSPNPGHIQIGTRSQNQLEAYARGLQPPRQGEGNGNVKLTDRKVTLIRKLYATGKYSQRELAQRVGVSQVRISQITRGRGWR